MLVEAREACKYCAVSRAQTRQGRQSFCPMRPRPLTKIDELLLSYVCVVAVILQLFYMRMTVMCGTSTPRDVPRTKLSL